MYELSIEDYFSAAHNLKDYNGDCEHLHGHNWKVRIIVRTENLDSTGLGIDFRDLRKILKEVLAIFDHKHLNDLESFQEENPSTENISRFIYMSLKEKLKSHKGIQLKKVISWEGNDASAAYFANC